MRFYVYSANYLLLCIMQRKRSRFQLTHRVSLLPHPRSPHLIAPLPSTNPSCTPAAPLCGANGASHDSLRQSPQVYAPPHPQAL